MISLDANATSENPPPLLFGHGVQRDDPAPSRRSKGWLQLTSLVAVPCSASLAIPGEPTHAEGRTGPSGAVRRLPIR